jgi:hypothetical protein
MRKLQSLLAKREPINFHHLNNRVRCYAHIINICSSHIVAALALDSDSSDSGSLDDESDDDDIDSNYDGDFLNSDEPKLADIHDSADWSEGIKRDPLGRARKLVRFLRSSDGRRTELRNVIKAGNAAKLFKVTGDNGERIPVIVDELHLLRDVKTRWDSVYMMLKRLREL